MRKSTYFILQLGIISVWLISCQPATTSPKPPVTFTPTMQPSNTPSASSPIRRPSQTPEATLIPSGLEHSIGTFGAGYFSGVFRSPDGKRIFVPMNGKELRWYDATTLEPQGEVSFHSPVMSYQTPYKVIFGPNPDRVAVVDYYAVWIIDVKSEKVLATLSGSILHNLSGVIFTPTGNALLYRATHHSSGSADTSADSSIGLWSIEKESQIPFKEQNWLHMTDPVISQDEKWVAAGCGRFIKVWDAQSGDVLRTMDAHGAILTGLAMSRDGVYLISSDQDGKVRLWDSKTGQNIHTFSLNKLANTITFMPNNEQILVGFSHDSPKLVDLQTLQITDAPVDLPVMDSFTMKLHHQGYSQSDNATLAISPDGKTLAVGNGTVLLWDIQTRKLLDVLETPGSYRLQEIKFDSTGQKLAGVSIYGNILLWDLTTINQPHLAKTFGTAVADHDLQGLSFSMDGKYISIGNGKNIEIWDVETGKQLRILSTTNFVFATKFSDDGQFIYVITGSNLDGKDIQVWDIEKSLMIRLIDFPKSSDILVFHLPSIAFTSADRIANDWVHSINIRDLETGKSKKLESTYDISPVVFSGDGNLLFAERDFGRLFLIWQIGTGKLAYISKHTEDDSRYDLSLLQTSNFVAISRDGIVQLFDIGTIIDYARQADITPVPLPTP